VASPLFYFIYLMEEIEMDSLSAFAMGEANRDKEQKVFDWVKAATLIKQRGAKNASAGLRGDWEYTGGEILCDGKPAPIEDTYVYLASTWATPELEIDGGEKVPCYRMASETPGWDCDTYWPVEALEILGGTIEKDS
jgi:hypothetical protein